MIRKKVCLVSPDDDVFVLNYSDVENFCKNICLNDENIEEFNLFKKNYNYFSPYFDFVIFKLNYIFVNGMFANKMGPFGFNDALYLYPIDSFNYKECIENATNIHTTYSPYPYMTKVSDLELGIKISDSRDTGDNMIDPNLYEMMSKSGTVEGSHGVTANSVLNQLLIKSPILVDCYYDYSKENDFEYTLDPINFLIGFLGFSRATANDINPIIISNMCILDEKIKQFIFDCEDNNYLLFDFDKDDAKSLIKEYKDIIKSN